MTLYDYSSHAEFYDEMMPLLTEESGEIAYYSDVLRGKQRIVEFGCGTGRVSFPLIQHLAASGPLKEYLGIDYSQEMIDVARRKLSERDDIPPVERIEFLMADATKTIPKLEEGAYDAAIAVCGLTSLLGVDRLAAFFRNARFAVAPGGTLVLDSLDPEIIRASVAIVDRSYMRTSDSSGLASFVGVSGDRYNAEFVWISGSTARRFSEESQLVPPEVLDEVAKASGFRASPHESDELQHKVAQVNGPVMYFRVYTRV
ncbi:class I SAM-dependent methyltransferase [Microbacterium lacticum]